MVDLVIVRGGCRCRRAAASDALEEKGAVVRCGHGGDAYRDGGTVAVEEESYGVNDGGVLKDIMEDNAKGR